MSYFFYFLGCLFFVLIIVFFIQKRETLVNPIVPGATGATDDQSQDPDTSIDRLFSTQTSQPTNNASDLLFGGATEAPFVDSTEDPYRSRQAATEAPYEGATEDLYRATEGPFGATEGPFGVTEGPFGATEGPFGSATEGPFGATEGPFGATEGPFGSATEGPSATFSTPTYGGEPSDVSDLPPPFGGNASLDTSVILSTPTQAATLPFVTFDLTTDDIAVNTVASEEVLSQIATTPALVERTPPPNVMMAAVNSELSSSTTKPSATATVSTTVPATSPPATEAPTIFMSSWSFWENKDYPKNDLPGPFKNRFVRQTTNSCQNLCDRNSKCVGIVTNFQGANRRGECWLKKSMPSENAVHQPDRFARKKIKIPYTSK